MANLKSADGATLIEYALLVALVGVIAIASLSLVGENSADVMCRSGGVLNDSQQILSWHPGHQCCGFSVGGALGGFACVR